VRTPDLRPILRSSAFRTTVAFASAFTGGCVLLFAFIYWQTASFETARIDRFLVNQIRLIAAAPPQEVLWIVRSHVATDLHRVTFAALFDTDGHLIAGNIGQVPDDLPADDRTHWVRLMALDIGAPYPARVIAVARRLPDGRLLVLGRDIEELSNLRDLVGRALALGVIPAVLLALCTGVWVGHLTSARVRSWQRILNRVREGHLSERLPASGRGGDVDRLADSVNHMLDELERLFGELHSIGNNIAHDLRTPLARVRGQLERTRRTPHGADDLGRLLDEMIAGLDQSIAITTSLLRIAEIESSRRRHGFAPVDLAAVSREVAEFYDPAAERRNISVALDLRSCPPVHGDRDLLFEAVANLVDNAIKFTPDGGHVSIAVHDSAAGPTLSVSDTGPGIPAKQRGDVFKRFVRLNAGQTAPGFGLGLSLVAAIARLHGHTLAIEDGRPGCIVILTCASASAPGTAPSGLDGAAPRPTGTAGLHT
jgi:signal transduction histidine kinase